MTLTHDVRREVADVLARRRARTWQLVDPLSDHDVHRQIVDFLSPLVWDVGHIGNFEELWLLRKLDGRAPHDAALDQVYNPFENPRWTRSTLATLDRGAAVGYLADVRRDVLSLLDDLDPSDPLVADAYVHRMIAQHEAQHQETILQALDLAPSQAFPPAAPTPASGAPRVDDEARVHFPGANVTIGTDALRWTYDNERPAHHRRVAPFDIDVHPVTNRRFAAFIAAGGYDDLHWWSTRGRDWLAEHGHRAPQGWEPTADGDWNVKRLGWTIPLNAAEPVQHVTFFEAEAFAAWAGGRLPTEFEWEAAATHDPANGATRRHPWGDQDPDPTLANVGLVNWGPRRVGSYPAGASPIGVHGMVGDVYEWTTSPFDPYDDFTAFPYPEYSEVFFGGDWRVLRGSSWAIAGSMGRATYRNWDHPYRRQIFSGIRLVWEPSP